MKKRIAVGLFILLVSLVHASILRAAVIIDEVINEDFSDIKILEE